MAGMAVRTHLAYLWHRLLPVSPALAQGLANARTLREYTELTATLPHVLSQPPLAPADGIAQAQVTPEDVTQASARGGWPSHDGSPLGSRSLERKLDRVMRTQVACLAAKRARREHKARPEATDALETSELKPALSPSKLARGPDVRARLEAAQQPCVRMMCWCVLY
jgi:hypothetical protein